MRIYSVINSTGKIMTFAAHNEESVRILAVKHRLLRNSNAAKVVDKTEGYCRSYKDYGFEMPEKECRIIQDFIPGMGIKINWILEE